MFEVYLAARLLHATINPDPDLTRPRQLIFLLLYGVLLAPAIASTLASFFVNGVFAIPTFRDLQDWFTADALGCATVTPLYLSFYRRQSFEGRSWTEIAALFLALCMAIVATFWQTRFPLLFFVFPFLLLIGLRLRLAGSALGLLIVSIAGGYLTISGRGPVALIHASLSNRILFFQCFILMSMLALYIMEITTSESNRLQQRLQSSETRFRLLAEVSRDIIVLTDLGGDRQYVSPAVTEVLGWLPQELLHNDYRQIVHPEDMENMEKALENCREGRPTNVVVYRALQKDGTYLWVEASLRLYLDPVTAEPAGFVNVVRDISRRKAAEDALNQAFRLAENLASVDSLTGIANRRVLDDTLEFQWRRAARTGAPIALLMFDVDHFKQYNDIYGHLEGDECLRRIVAAVRVVVHRSSDLLARYGGEEFVVVLPDTAIDGAVLIAEQIRQAVEHCGIPHVGSDHRVVTISVGCAAQRAENQDSSSGLLGAADSALYRAKSAGRNCIEASPIQ
jgi:diguanylate cyclase (GGDEF)-like protein/PAS domain S-box-containing protein